TLPLSSGDPTPPPEGGTYGPEKGPASEMDDGVLFELETVALRVQSPLGPLWPVTCTPLVLETTPAGLAPLTRPDRAMTSPARAPVGAAIDSATKALTTIRNRRIDRATFHLAPPRRPVLARRIGLGL